VNRDDVYSSWAEAAEAALPGPWTARQETRTTYYLLHPGTYYLRRRPGIYFLNGGPPHRGPCPIVHRPPLIVTALVREVTAAIEKVITVRTVSLTMGGHLNIVTRYSQKTPETTRNILVELASTGFAAEHAGNKIVVSQRIGSTDVVAARIFPDYSALSCP
jgi:hypothetical protein